MKSYSSAAMAKIREAQAFARGKYLDPDGMYGYQCVDVADWLAEYLSGIPWQTVVGGVNGAVDLPDVAPAKYWEWQGNVVGDESVVPSQGDVIIFHGTPTNPWGHVAWVVSATPWRVRVLEQNTYGTADTPVQEREYGYNGEEIGAVRGWLRLREEYIKGLPQKTTAKPATSLPKASPKKMLTFISDTPINVRNGTVAAAKVIHRTEAYPSGKDFKASVDGWKNGITPAGSSSPRWYRTVHRYGGRQGWIHESCFKDASTTGLPQIK